MSDEQTNREFSAMWNYIETRLAEDKVFRLRFMIWALNKAGGGEMTSDLVGYNALRAMLAGFANEELAYRTDLINAKT